MTIATHILPYGSTNHSFSTTDMPLTGNESLKQLFILKDKSQLNRVIAKKRNVPDFLAINLYWDTLRTLYMRKKYTPKINGLPLSYQELSEIHGVDREAIRKKFVRLEELKLVSRSFQHSNTLVNQLVIYVWKDTPYFVAPFGSCKEAIKELIPSTSHSYLANKDRTQSDDIALRNKLPLVNGGKND